jgi:asparagine synthase (glutamine-hydrolysing)
LLRPSICTLARNLNASDSDRLLALLGSFNEDPGRVLRRNASSSWRFIPEEGAASPGLTAPGAPERGLTLTYLRGYLQEDILVKVDRASMAASLEVRAPFLDPTIVDFALSLPLALKRRGRTGKVLLRQLMRSRLPDSVFSRRKQGFGAPVSNWLRGPLRASAADLLSPARLTEQGLFREREIAWMFDRHLTGKADFGRQLWAILLFQLWWQAFDIQLGGSADPPPRPVLDEVIRRSHP